MKIREKRIPWRKSEIKNRVPSNKGKEWTPTYGKGYNLDKKQHTIKPLLERMETRGILGETIMDIGSGSIKMYESEPVGTNPKERITSMGSGIFYPAKGKKIVRVDIGLPAPIRTKKGIVEIKADAENLRPETFSDKVRFVQAARHLGISPRSRKKPVDSVLMSAVLNYVDFRKAITEASRYLKRGGRIIIHNEPGRGFSKLFSQKGAHSNHELVRAVEELGFEIEFLAKESNHPKEYPFVEKVSDEEGINLVAIKKK